MHDLLLAKEILETALKYAKDKGLASLSEIMVELGQVDEHAEEITPKNLKEIFNLIKANTIAKKAKLIVNPPAGGKKVSGSHWRLISIS